MKNAFLLLLCLYASLAIGQTTHSTFSEKAIKKNNEAVSTYLKAYGRTDSLNKAVRLTDEAIAIDSSYAPAYINKAQYLNVLGKTLDAFNVISEAQRKTGEDPQLNLFKGVLSEKLGKKECATDFYNQAIVGYEKQLKGKPDDYVLLMNRAFVKMLIGSGDDATQEFKSLENKFKENSKEQKQLRLLMKVLLPFDRERFIRDFWAR